MIRTGFRVFLASLGVLSCWAQAAGTGQISGTVVDESGQPVELAFVSITRFPYNPKEGPASVGYTTAKDGKFTFTGLGGATYSACVYTALQRGFLDTCEWRKQTDLALKDGASATGVVLKIEKGAQVTFEVSDPQGLKAAADSAAAVPIAHFGLVSDIGSHHYGRFYYSQDGKHTYILNVPFGRTMSVRVVPVSVSVTDSSGRSIATETVVPATAFTLSKTDAVKKITLSVAPAAVKQGQQD